MSRTVNPKMKSRHIAACLRQKIRSKKLLPGTLLPSAHDLALQYNVCMMTANKALDILEKESLIVREKGIGNFVQRNIMQGRRILLGIADITDYSSNYARKILIDVFPKTAIEFFKSENCDYRVISYADFQQKNRKSFTELDGLLLSSNYVDDQTEDFIRSLSCPIVIYRSEYEMDLPYSQIIPDHSAAMDRLFSIVEKESLNGIVIFTHPHKNGRARCKAFETYAMKYKFSKDQIQVAEFISLDMRKTVLSLLPQIAGKLVITCSDLMTCELIQMLSENNLIAGKDYQLVSYDNLNKIMQMPPGMPEVTSIDYSRTAAAKTAAKLLIQLAGNPTVSHYQIIKFPTRLIIRDSAFKDRKDIL